MSRVVIRGATVIAVLIFSFTAFARSHKVLVLPLDGNADTKTRDKLTASIQKLARVLDGEISLGTTTFAETAAAVGCDPTQAICVDQVLATLGVDEIVWGTTVTTKNGQLTVSLQRGAKGTHTREASATIGVQDPPEKISSSLLPLFQPETTAPTGSNTTDRGGPGSSAVEAVDKPPDTGSDTLPIAPAPDVDHHDRNVGIGLAVGGAAAVVLGLALWASEGSLQDQINSHATRTTQDIANLRALEDRASKYAWSGNVAIAVGLAVGGYGAYRLWNDHKARANARLAPVHTEQGVGATFIIEGTW
ncbi:MAG: hypothetical protein JWO36_7071 [Myxococcales bacterium]|nr:hypothetical protein [Myxococcales bacterium]